MNLRFSWAPLMPPRLGARATKDATRLADWGGFIFLGLGILQVVLGFEDGALQFVALAAGILLFGLPHGAIDHLVALGLAARPLRMLPLLVTVALYLLAVGGVLILWVFSPVIAAFGFLVMTIYHWGKSDLAFERYVLLDTPKFRGAFTNFNHALLRGMIPIGVPFFAFPDQASDFLTSCIRLFSAEPMMSFDQLRGWVFPVFGFSLLIDLGIHLRSMRFPCARRVFVENILLVTFFWFVPPLLAIGWYFAGWHGLRHIIRLCYYERVGARAMPAIAGRIRTFAVQALPFTLVSVLMLLGLLGGLADRIPGAYEGVAMYLVLISSLTFPHLLIVEWMDHRENLTDKRLKLGGTDHLSG